jgi:hypothetical protein
MMNELPSVTDESLCLHVGKNYQSVPTCTVKMRGLGCRLKDKPGRTAKWDPVVIDHFWKASYSESSHPNLGIS